MKIMHLLFLSASLFLVGCQNTSPASSTTTATPTLASFVFYGEVVAETEEKICLDFPAKITKVNIQEGDLVKKGDILFTLDFSDYLYDMSIQENLITSYEAQLDGLISQANPYYSQMETIKKDLKTKRDYMANDTDPRLQELYNKIAVLEEQRALLKDQLDANQALFEIAAISEQTLKQDEKAYNDVQRNIETLQANITLLKTNYQQEITSLQNNLENLRLTASNTDADLNTRTKSLQVQLKGASLTLEHMKSKLKKPYFKDNQIIAPNDDLIVAGLYCTQGELLNNTNLISLLHQDSIYIRADIPEEDLSKIKLGDRVSIHLADDNLTTSPVTGKVRHVSNMALVKEGDTVVEAEIEVTEGKSLLKPGLTVDLTLEYTP